MNLNPPTPFVIFPDDFFNFIKSKTEFHVWGNLQVLWKKDKFTEDNIDFVIQHYTPIEDIDIFLEIQLQFFLIRNSWNCQYSKSHFIELITFWVTSIKGKFSLNSTELGLSFQTTTNSSLLNKFGKYYYSYTSYIDYGLSWNNCSVELRTWKKFSLLSIPSDLQFIKLNTEKHEAYNFSQAHMRKLFDEYVKEIYNSKFLPRLNNSILAENEKEIIDRVLKNVGTDNDKKYLNELCTNFYSWRNISTNLSRCLLNAIYNSELDIHSQSHFAGYFALIKYYEELIAKPKKKDIVKYAMWFKNATLEKLKGEEFKEAMKDVFDNINRYCPKATWGDFKSIFSKNGVKTKIEWTGDASILNFLFRTLHKSLSFNGSKWHVVTNYFYKSDQNDQSLDPIKLSSNSHYHNSDLEIHIKRLIQILGE